MKSVEKTQTDLIERQIVKDSEWYNGATCII